MNLCDLNANRVTRHVVGTYGRISTVDPFWMCSPTLKAIEEASDVSHARVTAFEVVAVVPRDPEHAASDRLQATASRRAFHSVHCHSRPSSGRTKSPPPKIRNPLLQGIQQHCQRRRSQTI